MKRSIFSLVVALTLTFFTASVFCQTELSNSVQQNPQVKKVADAIDEGKADAKKIKTEAEAAKENIKTTKTNVEKEIKDEVASKESEAVKKAETVKENVKDTKTDVEKEIKDEVASKESEAATKAEAVKENVKNTKTDAEKEIKDEVTSKESEAAKKIETEKEQAAKKEDTAEKSSGGKIFNYSKDKSRTEIEIKVGRTINAKPEIDRNEVKVDDVYTVGIEVMAYSNSFLGFGAGIYNIFDSKLKDSNGTVIGDPNGKGDYEIAFTNPYLTLKSKILQFDSDIIRNVYIYGQLGYGFMRIKNAYETEDGMYWGIGGGIEIWHFLLDVNYATNFGKIKMAPGENKIDVRQTTIIASIGYRFRL